MSLIAYLNNKIAQRDGIRPEQVTTNFITRLRGRMYADPQHQFDQSTEYNRDPIAYEPTSAELKKWDEKRRKWVQEVIAGE